MASGKQLISGQTVEVTKPFEWLYKGWGNAGIIVPVGTKIRLSKGGKYPTAYSITVGGTTYMHHLGYAGIPLEHIKKV